VEEREGGTFAEMTDENQVPAHVFIVGRLFNLKSGVEGAPKSASN
jgi:hypothetical protein